MLPPWEPIIATKFTADASDQDPVHTALFHFQFHFSKSAPPLWYDIAKNELESQGTTFVVQRRVAVQHDRLVIRCSPEEAQRIKDVLNNELLPRVNGMFVTEAKIRHENEKRTREEKQLQLNKVKAAIAGQK